MQQLFDNTELQKVQDYFCTLTHLYACCVNEEGKKLTEMSGDKEGLAAIRGIFSEEDFSYLFKKISASNLEDMVVEPTEYDNVKLAAVSVEGNGGAKNCWLICCIQNDVSGNKVLELPVPGIGTEAFYDALDLLAQMEHKRVRTQEELLSARAESQKTRCSEEEMSRTLKRMEAMTELVQFLESDGEFEKAGSEVARIVGEYLDVSGTGLFRSGRDTGKPDKVCGWTNKCSNFDFEISDEFGISELFTGEKPLIIPSAAPVTSGVRGEMLKYQMKAFISIPLFSDGKPVMYFCVNDREKSRAWQAEEVKFVKNAAMVVQSLLNKTIQRSSLSSSFASMQKILDNIGTCIYIKNAETGACLLANKLLKRTFELEVQNGTLDMLLANARPLGIKEGHYEIDYKERGKWYDLYRTEMEWIDGQKASLYAIYDITDKKIYQTRIEQQAYTDFLTGLYNRMCCEKDLAVQMDKARQQKVRGGFLYLDLDDFKHINEGLGHQYGDVLLQSVSHAFQRVEGIGESCYRMGGDEFVMIVPPESFGDMERIIAEIEDIFSEPWYLKDADYYCTMSMGVCVYPDDGTCVADLIKKADIAMYEAKKKGKNRIVRYSSGLSAASGKRLDMEKNMRDATGNDCREFRVYFQPIIDIQKPETPCVGAEALVRWDSAVMGFMPPGDFIPLAEYLGLITPIGSYVLREACLACKKWNDEGHPDYKVNVNLSVVQLLQSDITNVVKEIIRDTGIHPANLTLEVTESLAINDMKRMKIILNDIRKLGVKIALDDFGTGYSSLNHIREIPLDIIKVDKGFARGLADDEYSQSFIKMVAELAAAIDVSICVEGIETEEQYKVLEGMKVKTVQGYYFDKPLSREDFELKYVK